MSGVSKLLDFKAKIYLYTLDLSLVLNSFEVFANITRENCCNKTTATKLLRNDHDGGILYV